MHTGSPRNFKREMQSTCMMDDQPDLMAAMREENKEKQLQMLQHALNW